MSPRYAVVGGGIAGLAAAWMLAGRGDVCLYEASPRLGGKLATSEVAGLPVDEGAESFLVRTPEAVDLAREVGLGEILVHPRTSSASLFSHGRLRALPGGTVLGVPGNLRALAESRVLSRPGLLRAAADPWLPRSRPFAGDTSVGEAVARRLGREVVDRLVEPLLGGVYAGRADGLSVAATLPQLAPAVRSGASLVRAARRASPKAAAGSRQPVFATLVGGLGRLVAAVEGRLREASVQIRCGYPVTALERTDAGFRLLAEQPAEFDAVILACPAAPAARLLAHLAPAAAAELAAIDYASIAIATFAFDAASVAPPEGSGFLVPAVEGRTVKGVTFASAKWAHLAGRYVIVRASIGRAGDGGDLQFEDDELLARTLRDLAALAGLSASPIQARLTRWGGALPQYAPGHLDRVARIRAALGRVPGLAGCGAVYEGVGVPACIRSAQQAVAALG